mgnify:CR=1 FL=1|jgi:hypothetical protein|tara:strand:+ start:498 stop:674 length:177 start_codon:yes stop_codon:yes gene_type:complete
MKNKLGGAIEFFESLPEDVMIKIATYDWEALERICMALTLDVHLYNEALNKNKKKSLA